MTNTFASIYARHQEIKAQYEVAKAVGSEEGMAQARTDHRALMDSVEGTGKAFARIYRMYEDAMDVGNDYIDLADILLWLVERGGQRMGLHAEWLHLAGYGRNQFPNPQL